MEVSELSGALLDYWVAMALDKFIKVHYREWVQGPSCVVIENNPLMVRGYTFNPTTNWEFCGPLIDQFNISLDYECDEYNTKIHLANIYKCGGPNWKDDVNYVQSGRTPQEAICRVVVESVYGEEVEDIVKKL